MAAVGYSWMRGRQGDWEEAQLILENALDEADKVNVILVDTGLRHKGG